MATAWSGDTTIIVYVDSVTEAGVARAATADRRRKHTTREQR
jgi:hypothetical protein